MSENIHHHLTYRPLHTRYNTDPQFQRAVRDRVRANLVTDYATDNDRQLQRQRLPRIIVSDGRVTIGDGQPQELDDVWRYIIGRYTLPAATGDEGAIYDSIEVIYSPESE